MSTSRRSSVKALLEASEPSSAGEGTIIRLDVFGGTSIGGLMACVPAIGVTTRRVRRLTHDYMSNTTLRERFSLPQDDYQAVSVLIGEAVRLGRIAPADPIHGRRNARYVPYWAT